MTNHTSIAFRAPTWGPTTPADVEELNEPPEPRDRKAAAGQFQRTTIRRPSEQSSLLTKAIMTNDGDEPPREKYAANGIPRERRRSLISNASAASTADLTSDNGMTSPSRTSSPSPVLPEMAVLQLNGVALKPNNVSLLTTAVRDESQTSEAAEQHPAPKAAPRKRCIQFACAAKPALEQPPAVRPPLLAKAPSALEAPRRPCIKFACNARPASTQNTPPKMAGNLAPPKSASSRRPASPSTPKKSSALSIAALSPSPRQRSPRRSPGKVTPARPKFLRANSVDLVNDGSQFHEFASDLAREDDWIRQEAAARQTKLTINDTLTKENTIRRLATEAEEEAELEEEEEEAAIDGNDLDDLEAEGDDDDDEDEDEDGEHGDGYSTDEETGFAESDDSADEDDEDMVFWTPGKAQPLRTDSLTPISRRPPLREQHSDASTATNSSGGSRRRVKPQRIIPQPEAPDLPDSTDFVCGTLDEDRPLEEAYLSCMAARRKDKLRVIPQDIDPSFPASDPENNDAEEMYNPVHHSSDEEGWMHGEMEDLHHDQDRSRRRRKSEQASPRKYHSPPPKRHHSPAQKRHHSPPPKRFHSPPPKARARSPRPLFERNASPRRVRYPVPKAAATPVGSPRHGGNIEFDLAGRPGLIGTKSLPRPAAFFLHKHVRNVRDHHEDDLHIRGAIDIVKGLEKKRMRRREKFHQKYCDRARRGQIPERKRPLPGQGAERMKELGLMMAGKKDQGNYVLSI